MNINGILESIDRQISKLKQARSLLTDGVAPATSSAPAVKRRGRPKGSVNKTTKTPAKVSGKVAKRTLSEEGKQRIAAAQKARWATKKKSVKAPGKNISSTKKAAKKTGATSAAAITGV